MRVCFLDFDGVLNDAEFLQTSKDHEDTEAGELNPVAVARLNRIVTATDAAIVVSSSWRYGRTVEHLRGMLESRGFLGRVIDKTADWSKFTDGNVYAAKERGDEIRSWLDEHPEVDTFVVLDDDSDMSAVRDRHIKTSFHGGGLLDEHVDMAIRMLSEGGA